MTRSLPRSRRTSDRLRGAALAAAAAVGAALGVAGCATQPAASGHVEAAYTKAFAAAERALAPAAVARADRDAGVIESEWVEGLSERTRGSLLEAHFVERRQVALKLWPEGARTGVEVAIRAEERAPGGTMALRWRRTEVPAGAGEAVLEKIRAEAKK